MGPAQGKSSSSGSSSSKRAGGVLQSPLHGMVLVAGRVHMLHMLNPLDMPSCTFDIGYVQLSLQMARHVNSYQ